MTLWNSSFILDSKFNRRKRMERGVVDAISNKHNGTYNQLTRSKVRNTSTSSYIIMNSKLSIIGIYGILMISIIFIMPQSNTDSKVFAQTVATGDNQSSTSKTNTITTATNAASSHTASNAYLNFNRAEGTIANIQDNESGKPTWILSGTWSLIIPEPSEVTSSREPTSAMFHAHFEMIKTNGKEMHSHSISLLDLIS